MPSEDERENDIEGSMDRMHANGADLTPTVARLINPLAVPSLQILVLSGEAVGKDLVSQWPPTVRPIDAYGPAECQICTIQTDLAESVDATNIGRGYGCTTWIVDSAREALSPLGAIVELVIEGPIVSPDYLTSDANSTSGWIRDPNWLLKGVGEHPGRRGMLYRTGDLARYNVDGTITYFGRTSMQVKINGQRVELGKIESSIRRCIPSLRGVVVDIVDIEGSNHLCAFLHHKWEDELVLHQNCNYFDIGGDSITAMKLSAISSSHDVELTVKSIMQHPELRSMALVAAPISGSLECVEPFSLLPAAQWDETLSAAGTLCGVFQKSIEDVYPCTQL